MAQQERGQQDVPHDLALQEAFEAFIHQTHVPGDFHASVMERVHPQRARRGRWGWESFGTWWTQAWSPRGVWAATVCGLLSLALNVGLGYDAWHRMQAVTRLEYELTAAQGQVRAVQAEQQAWQARYADLTHQLAALQKQEQRSAPREPPTTASGTALRGQPYTVAALAQALFPENRGRTFRVIPFASVPKAPVVLPLSFAPASAAIEPLYFIDLDRLGSVLTQPQYAASRVWIVGYTDSLEAPGTETALARQRAEAVQRYLVEHFSIAPERLLVHGEGARHPRAPNDTPEGRSANRRVELVAME